MSSATDLLAGVKVLEEVKSPINGKIQVVKSLAFGTYIQVEGLTQSGGVIYSVWKKTLKKLRNMKPEARKCLILGLGGGSVAKIVRKYWPKAEITGVDVDPVIVELGKKYLGLEKLDIKIVIKDALEFLTEHRTQNTEHYDLILVDVYVGYGIPEKFKTDKFIGLVKKLISKDGIAVFNRLYSNKKRREAEIFHRKLIQAFKKVRPIYPVANVMFVCSR